jgi:MFS-type transporter involved in bile tolerance (Atg22 family)
VDVWMQVLLTTALVGGEWSASRSSLFTLEGKHYTMKTYGGVDVWMQGLLTTGLVGGEWSASRSSALPCKVSTAP